MTTNNFKSINWAILVFAFIVGTGVVHMLGANVKKATFEAAPPVTEGQITSLKDARIYEFTPETAPSVRCVFVQNHKSSDLFCFEKKDG